MLSRIEDPVGDLFLVPQYDYVIDVVFVRMIMTSVSPPVISTPCGIGF